VSVYETVGRSWRTRLSANLVARGVRCAPAAGYAERSADMKVSADDPVATTRKHGGGR
jgi:hypothetical protein